MRDWTKNTCPNWLTLFIYQHNCVIIKSDMAAITAATLHCCANNHTIDNITLLNLSTGLGLLDRPNDDVTQLGTFFTLQSLDAHHTFRS
ncbi:hypothetical protein LUZ62_041399 [Rhynchospora pubera]|uniref:Uncharacterized protein n=1 Tax=Rhynchospora pubera TaxID=906938 RepID=A0AAV8FA72_9POAL|nr:hypothetical protein LUZ62_041399 [Rhynchospora pubera]